MSSESDTEIEQRRQRLQALRAKREALSVKTEMTTAEVKVAGKGRSGDGRPRLGGSTKQLLANLLLKTLQGGVAGQFSRLPGRDYTEQGVVRLVTILRKRAEDPSTPGAEVAKRILQTITRPNSNPTEMIAGVNLSQIDRLIAFARQSLTVHSGMAGGVGRGGVQAAANGESIEQMRVTIRQLASTIDSLTRKLQQFDVQNVQATPVAASQAEPRPLGGGTLGEKSGSTAEASTDSTDWVDDFVEDR